MNTFVFSEGKIVQVYMTVTFPFSGNLLLVTTSRTRKPTCHNFFMNILIYGCCFSFERLVNEKWQIWFLPRKWGMVSTNPFQTSLEIGLCFPEEFQLGTVSLPLTEHRVYETRHRETPRELCGIWDSCVYNTSIPPPHSFSVTGWDNVITNMLTNWE